MKKILLILFCLLAMTSSAQVPISGLPPATLPLTGAEVVPLNQGGVTRQTAISNISSPPGTQGATLNAKLVATSNITLSGTQTIDGIAASVGDTVLAASQTTASTRGLYVVASGSWTRAAAMATGLVIPSGTNFAVLIRQGTVNGGILWQLTTTGSITVGTTAQTWTQRPTPLATATVAGTMLQTGGGATAPSMTLAPSGLAAGAIGDCVGFTDINGSIGDGTAGSQLGLCDVTDPNFHIRVQNAAPTVTGTGCSLNTGSRDTRGSVTATGADVCTITYSGAYTLTGGAAVSPFCVVSGYSSTVLPFISTPPSNTAVVVTTAAAGTFSYVCL